jgi:(R,R)-butanediol dehydrogenase/meso-butanediol dehydrogenase/diacetyl reductase
VPQSVTGTLHREIWRMSQGAALPDTMRAAVYLEKGRVEVQDRPLPALGPRDVLLRVSHCGVCGTDLHMVLDGWGRPDSIGGHEFSGRIAAHGDRVSGWRVGDAVVGGPVPGCGGCEGCRAGRPGLCSEKPPAGVAEFEGAFAGYVKLDERQLFRVPAGLPLREAALTEPLAVALHGIRLSGIRPGQRALVSGAGPIGALTVAALRAGGVEEIAVCEPRAARRALAEALGASRVLEPDALEVPPMPFAIVDEAVDVVFECSGKAPAFEAGLAQLGRAGRLAIVGTGMERPRLDPNRVLLNELTIVGCYEYDATGFDDALALLASGALPTDLLIEAADVPLDELLPAMHDLVTGRLAGKVLVRPR